MPTRSSATTPPPRLGVVAYAGVPLATADGLSLGTFCAIDPKPRAWTRDRSTR